MTKETRDVVEAMISECAAQFGVAKKDLLSESRKQEHVMPRYALMYAVCETLWPYVTYRDIGAILGGRHYSSILNAREKIRSLVKSSGSAPEIKMHKLAFKAIVAVAPDGFRDKLKADYQAAHAKPTSIGSRANIVDGYLARLENNGQAK